MIFRCKDTGRKWDKARSERQKSKLSQPQLGDMACTIHKRGNNLEALTPLPFAKDAASSFPSCTLDDH